MRGCSVKVMVCPSSSISSWLEISVSTLEECLKYDNRRSFQLGGIEGEEYVHGAIGFGRDERGLSSHLLGRSPGEVRLWICP